jgi:plastocyanin
MKQSTRYRALAATFVLGLGLAAIPGNASADPIEDYTGQSHPGDVFTYGFQYFPSEVHISRGQTFKFANYDVIQGIPSHSIDQLIPGCTAPPYGKGAGKNCPPTRFSSGLVDWMQVHEVHGTEKLAPGSYPFVCQVHPSMRGTLVVE